MAHLRGLNDASLQQQIVYSPEDAHREPVSVRRSSLQPVEALHRWALAAMGSYAGVWYKEGHTYVAGSCGALYAGW